MNYTKIDGLLLKKILRSIFVKSIQFFDNISIKELNHFYFLFLVEYKDHN